MTKTKELTDPTSCVSKALHDEWMFVLLGRDASAPAAIHAWAMDRVARGKNKVGDALLEEAAACADAMEAQRDAIRARLDDWTPRSFREPAIRLGRRGDRAGEAAGIIGRAMDVVKAAEANAERYYIPSAATVSVESFLAGAAWQAAQPAPAAGRVHELEAENANLREAAMATTTLLEFVIRRACERYGHNGCELTTAAFQHELSVVSDSKPMVTSQVAELLLLSVPGVTRTGLCMWEWSGLKF